MRDYESKNFSKNAIIRNSMFKLIQIDAMNPMNGKFIHYINRTFGLLHRSSFHGMKSIPHRTSIP